MDEKECQKRWKQLREKYVREKKKIEGKSGDPGPTAVSCWPLFNKMDFLRGTVKHKRCLYFKKVFLLIQTFGILAALL